MPAVSTHPCPCLVRHSRLRVLPPSGQRCTAVKLVAVVDSVADQLVALVAAAVAKLRVGRPEDDADITPVVSESSANFIEGLVVDAREKGGWEQRRWGLGRGAGARQGHGGEGSWALNPPCKRDWCSVGHEGHSWPSSCREVTSISAWVAMSQECGRTGL